MGRLLVMDSEGATLRLLGAGPVQGYDVCARLAQRTGLVHSAAYGVLYTLESRGLVASRAEVRNDGVERRWYTLTSKGERRALKVRAVEVSVPNAAVAAGVIA